MYRRLQETFNQDKDLPDRTFRLQMLARVLEGTVYDNLKHAFHEEKDGSEQYIPLRDRRPSVRYGVCRLVVDDSVSLLFSEGHFPKIEATDETSRDNLARIVKEIGLNEVMIDAATRGSVGSVVLHLRILNDRIFVDVLPTPYLTPVWDKDAPDKLERVIEQYKVKGSDLSASGYPITEEEMGVDFWFRREWDTEFENWFFPVKVSDKKDPSQIDEDKTVEHGLGFVPMVWVKNLPGGDQIDGKCTFPVEAIDTGIEIDYQLSQVGRGLKYSQDPTLLIKEPAFGGKELVRTASNAIKVDASGDAKLLEINGTASQAVLEYVRALREYALETLHGNRANADKISAAQSGRAMELMNQALIWLADKLRISYGEGALLDLLKMICAAGKTIGLQFRDGGKVGELNPDGLALRWPAWYAPTASDLSQMATALRSLIDANVISEKTATKTLAAAFDIEDVDAERKLIEAERKIREANAQKQIKINE